MYEDPVIIAGVLSNHCWSVVYLDDKLKHIGQRATLEDVFVKLTGRMLREG